tara:strand:- start:1994 stop:3067 length:1074 start_codon:yes stop_codon:yes gene_type:complete
MNKKIIFTAGGTGGHIFPAINLMKNLSEKGYQVLLVTDLRGKNFTKRYPELKTLLIKAATLTNKNLLRKLFSIFIIFYSLIQALFILKREKPDLVFGFGGYTSFPISFVSKFFNIPLVIYENNMTLGRANKYLASFSKKIFISREITNKILDKNKNKIFQVGPILDKKIINYTESKKNNNIFSILAIGGSQGAEVFGQVIPEVIKKLNDKNFKVEINQQCIKGQQNEISNFYHKNNIKNYVFEFDKNILKLILSSDVAITRCGASTTAELAYTLTPFIAIPLPGSIDNHQYLNAKYYERTGCCWVMEQKNFNVNSLYNLIENIINNKSKLENIRQNMKKIYGKNVYNDIENEIKEFI